MATPAGTSYVTTPIYYVNDRPHIGHCYTTLVADCFARFERLRRGGGEKVFFLTGTDEHADKVVTSAQQHGMTAIHWADRNAEEFRKAFAFMNASNDDFIRTTQERHKTRVTEYVSALLKTGDIYKGSYEGWYDENQEEYLTETVAKEQDFKSATTSKPLVRRKEDCYFFRLSKYQKRLEELFAKHPEFVQPEARRNEVVGRMRDGLQDVAASRPVTSDPATQFGIRVPGDDGHRIYVWIDALFNYLSVVDTGDRREFWPAPAARGEDVPSATNSAARTVAGVTPAPHADAQQSTCVHFIAKDILWFHAVIWPAMLMALHDADPERFGFVGLPTAVYSHAYWVREGKKMSKSLKNFIEIEQLQAYAAKYSLDALRWYLLTQGPLFATDADFSHAKFVEVYNADLANGIGNCASRVANMIEKYFGGKVPQRPNYGVVQDTDAPRWSVWINLKKHAERAVVPALQRLSLSDALWHGKQVVTWVDGLINDTRPFSLAKTMEQDPTAKEMLQQVLYDSAEALRIASILLSPAMPQKMAALQKLWNCVPPAGATLEALCTIDGEHALKPGQQIIKGEALFMRADPTEAPPA
jgi:methionyl-tRNA synthetase